jgi:hypothetical protein
MAATGYVDTLFNTLDATIRVPLSNAFQYAMRELSIGSAAKADNFLWFKVTGTTPAAANTEFSIVHGMDHAPTKLIPILPLDSTGWQLVPLKATRKADSKRVYLTSASTSALFLCYLE